MGGVCRARARSLSLSTLSPVDADAIRHGTDTPSRTVTRLSCLDRSRHAQTVTYTRHARPRNRVTSTDAPHELARTRPRPGTRHARRADVCSVHHARRSVCTRMHTTVDPSAQTRLSTHEGRGSVEATPTRDRDPTPDPRPETRFGFGKGAMARHADDTSPIPEADVPVQSASPPSAPTRPPVPLTILEADAPVQICASMCAHLRGCPLRWRPRRRRRRGSSVPCAARDGRGVVEPSAHHLPLTQRCRQGCSTCWTISCSC